MKFQKETKILYNLVTVPFPQNDSYRLTTEELFNLGAEKFINVIYTQGINDGLTQAKEIIDVNIPFLKIK